MKTLLSCEFNMDTGCVELRYSDDSMISINCTAVEDEVANSRFQQSELDYLIYNDPVAYADLILNGDPKAYFFRGGGDIVEVDDYIAEFVVEGNNERAFISMNTQNIVRLEVDDGNGIQVIDIDSGKPFAIVLPLNVGNICFYDTNGNVVEYLRQQL